MSKFLEFVGYLVQGLKVLCSTMGRTRIANVLCRAGLHLGSTTVRRMLKKRPRPKQSCAASKGENWIVIVADRITSTLAPALSLRETIRTDPRLSRRGV